MTDHDESDLISELLDDLPGSLVVAVLGDDYWKILGRSQSEMM